MLVKIKIMWIPPNKKLNKWKKKGKRLYKVDSTVYKAGKNINIKVSVNG